MCPVAIQKLKEGTFLAVQWIRVCLPITRHKFNPWSGKMPHAVEQHVPQLSEPTSSRVCEPQGPNAHAATTEAQAPGARALKQENPVQPQQTVPPTRHNQRNPEYSSKDPVQPYPNKYINNCLKKKETYRRLKNILLKCQGGCMT